MMKLTNKLFKWVGNKLTAIVLPASIKSLGDRAFALCGSLQRIYCKAIVPPQYIPATEYDSDITPFADVNPLIPIYVPVGTKNQYMTAPGWDYMTNFIEIEDFPTACIENLTSDNPKQNSVFYDLFGRKTSTLLPGNVYIRNGKKFINK